MFIFMQNSDYELKVVRLKQGYGIELPARDGLNRYLAVVFYENKERVSLFEINGRGRKYRDEKRFVKKFGVWVSENSLSPSRFFPQDSLEHLAFELLHESMIKSSSLEVS